MSKIRLIAAPRFILSCWLGAILLGAGTSPAQTVGRQPLQFRVSGPVERLEMIANTSRILTTEHNIPRLLVENENIVRAKPIAPNQVQVSALKPGFTNLTVWDETEKEHTIDVLVYGDSRELENLLMTEFPDATLRVRPLQTSVIISGYVPRAEMVSRIVEMAQDYYPEVINNITIGGVQQVLLHVKLMEVSRTKLRKMGFDWYLSTAHVSIFQNAAGLLRSAALTPGTGTVTSTGGEDLALGVVSGNTAFFGFLEALRQYNLVKVLAEPTLVTVSGRPASFNSGGEFPIIVPQSLGTVSIEYRQFGTRVDFVPIVLGNGRVRLEVRPQVSEIDPARNVTIANTTVPGLRTRWVDTAVEMNAGQTLALAGLIQTQVESENRGLPWLSDLPWFGAAFRRVEQSNNEVELLVLVTPEFVDALDPSEVPPCGPGQSTTAPNDVELYWRGYLEVPRCCNDGSCPQCRGEGPVLSDLPPNPMPDVEPVPLPRGDASGASASVQDTRSVARRPDAVPASEPRLIGPVGYDQRN
jgi:pilus assembly protein CpaC